MMLKEYGRPFTMVELEQPRLGSHDVLLRVKACGVCGTDVKIRDGLVAAPIVVLPHVPGHEVAGEVVEVGDCVEAFRAGDRAAVYLYVTCGECRHCRSGRENLCLYLRRIGFELFGGFAEYLVVAETQLVPIDEEIPYEQAAILPDAVAVSYHALKRQAGTQVGDRVLVVGIGGVGIHAVQIAKCAGAEVIAAEVADDKLALALQHGADHAINPRTMDCGPWVKEVTGGVGVDAVIENVGSAESLAWTLPALRKGGKLVLVGYCPAAPFPCDSMAMHYNEWEIIGSRLSTKQDLLECVELVRQGRITPLVTKRYPLHALDQALDDLAADEVFGRAVVVP